MTTTKRSKPTAYCKVELTKREADIIQHALKALEDNNNFEQSERIELRKITNRFVLGDWKL